MPFKGKTYRAFAAEFSPPCPARAQSAAAVTTNKPLEESTFDVDAATAFRYLVQTVESHANDSADESYATTLYVPMSAHR